MHREENFINEHTEANSLQADTILSLASTGIPNTKEPITSDGNHRNLVEGVAELAEMYIGGYEEFMFYLGPLDPYAGEVYSLFYSGDLPKDKLVRNSSEIVGRLGVLYTRGLKEFIKSLELFLGPDKSFEIYSQMRALYEGVEFTGLDQQGVPVRQIP